MDKRQQSRQSGPNPTIYQPLARNHIRLLRIKRRGRDLTVSLRAQKLNVSKLVSPHSSAGWQAVSYAWGAPGNEKELECNGTNILVRQNLYDFLEEIAPGANGKSFWIDALCINQADDPEKMEQLRLMNDIYRHADRVLVWLGKVEKGSSEERCMQDFKFMLSVIREGGSRITAGMMVWSPISPDHSFYAAFLLFSRRWFKRLWVVPEVTMNSTVMVKLGRQEMLLDELIDGAIDLRSAVKILVPEEAIVEPNHTEQGFLLLRDWTTALRTLEVIKHVRYEWQTRSQLSHSALLLARNLEISNQEDRVFAILGLIDPVYHRAISTLHQPSVEKVYFEFSRCWLLFSRDLRLLNPVIPHVPRARSDVQERTTASLRPGSGPLILPSWVLDLRVSYGRSNEIWATSEDLPKADPLAREACFSISGTCLHVRGCEVDEISHIVALDFPVSQWSRDCAVVTAVVGERLALSEWEAECAKIARNAYMTVKEAEHAHECTLFAGSEYELRRFPPYGMSLRTVEDIESTSQRVITALKHQSKPQRLVSAIRHLWSGSKESLPETGYQESLRLNGVLTNLWFGKRYFATKRGRVGIAFDGVRPGDKVYILQAGATPYIIRPIKQQDTYEFCGEAYIHGISRGELFKSDGPEMDWKVIDLV